MGRKRQIIISILALLSLTLVTTGVSYSLLDYDENDRSSKSRLTYNYTSIDEKNELSIVDSVPLSDVAGKKLSGDENLFKFSVDGTIEKGKEIPYEITVAKDTNSTLSGDFVKLYLTEVVDGKEYPINTTISQDGVVKKYSELATSSVLDTWENRIIYQGIADYENDGTFHRDYYVRIWIDGDTKIEPEVLTDGTLVYPYQNKKFTIKINVNQKEN